MLKRRTRRDLIALAILVVTVIAILFAEGAIPLYSEICKYDKNTGHENCAAYNTALVVLWHILESLNDYGVAITAIATIFIGGFTGTLWYSTKLLWREARVARRIALRSAKAATKAANVAERALVDLERPYLFIDLSEEVFAGVVTTYGGGPIYNFPRHIMPVNYWLYNAGRTPAILTHHRKMVLPIRDADMPSPIPRVVKTDDALPNGFAIDKRSQFSANYVLVGPSDLDHLFLIGFVRYEDIFHNEHLMGYCAKFDRRTNRFVLEGDDRYNYRD